MIPRHLSSMTTSSCLFLALSSRRTFTRQSRHLATSAQKRKWQRKEGNKRFLKKKYASVKEEELTTTTRKASKNDSWQPLFFLGVFPVFLSIVVVLSRDDLREEVNSKGIGRFVEDYKKWKRRPLSTPNAYVEEQPLEEESEYDKMMHQLAQQKP